MAFYQQVKIASLTTMDECSYAEDRIERDPESYTSPAAAWKGAPCTFKAGAQKKLAAVGRKWDALADKADIGE